MSVNITIDDHEIHLILKSLSVLLNIHLGQLSELSIIPNITESFDREEFRYKLLALTPIITTLPPGKSLTVEDGLVSNEAKEVYRLQQKLLKIGNVK